MPTAAQIQAKGISKGFDHNDRSFIRQSPCPPGEEGPEAPVYYSASDLAELLVADQRQTIPSHSRSTGPWDKSTQTKAIKTLPPLRKLKPLKPSPAPKRAHKAMWAIKALKKPATPVKTRSMKALKRPAAA